VLKTIALFGGTFDPIHRGHLQSAKEIVDRLTIDELRFLPCHLPAHKETVGANSLHRLAMVQTAVKQLSIADPELAVCVDDREIRRNTTSYSVETLKQMRNELGDEVSLIWIMGTDAFANFDQWYHWQQFLSLAHIVVITRPDTNLPQTGPVAELMSEATAENTSQLKRQSAGCLWFESLTPYPVSSTQLRAALATNKSAAVVAENITPCVLKYIEQHKLYLK
jgi:nicotinate-nucleotide adenylyltransferase